MKKKLSISTPTPTHFASDVILRSLAVTTVIFLHVLSSLKGGVYTTVSWHHLTIGLDQLGRFCIPLFVALSGYGLMQKYQTKPFTWSEFLERRVFKLLPAYCVASLIFYLIFWFLPSWQASGEILPFWKQLLLGRADYHLYFVPMIFQLYLVFPLIMGLVKKYPWLSLTVAAIFQVGLYSFYQARGDVFARDLYLVTDQQQYAWGFTWIFYFILGMCLPLIHSYMRKHSGWVIAALLLTIFSWWWTATNAMTQIDGGIDPIVALRFTRLPLLLYGTTSVITLTWLANQVRKAPSILVTLANRSYWLYLSHTLFLRILFTFIPF